MIGEARVAVGVERRVNFQNKLKSIFSYIFGFHFFISENFLEF